MAQKESDIATPQLVLLALARRRPPLQRTAPAATLFLPARLR
jgi:hypothetical protein